MLSKKPKQQRIGQTIFNFLEWLQRNNECDNQQSNRMGDPFNISDKRIKELYGKFLSENKN